MTAASSAGSEKTNILTRSDFDAVAMAARIGLAESSGRTSRDRDDMQTPALRFTARGRGRIARAGLDAVQLRVDAAERHQFRVCALLRDAAALEDDDGVRVADGAQTVGDGDHRAPFHQSLEGLHH